MAEIINLRQARKARQRAASEQTAVANRAKFGQTKGEKAKQQADAERETRKLDGMKIEESDRKAVAEQGVQSPERPE